MDWLEDLRTYMEYGSAPTLEEMPRLTLEDKGISGPTSAHRIEEVHTPFNLAYITFTTGSTAFQNIVGVTESEIEDRIEATSLALEMCGISPKDEILFTYPPLVNVFSKQALEQYGVTWSFLEVSSRDAVLLALFERKPKAVIGESSFLRATLEGAKKMGVLGQLPPGLVFIAAGTPLDLGLPDIVKEIGGSVHDLYGCQEFGWLTLDGVMLRKDITLLSTLQEGYSQLAVGGLPTGDAFPVAENSHFLNPQGLIITYNRVRAKPDMETVILQTTAASAETVDRLSRTILRIKSKIVRVSEDVVTGANHTILSLSPQGRPDESVRVEGPEKTRLFDSLLAAQLQYQSQAKSDPTWIKGR